MKTKGKRHANWLMQCMYTYLSVFLVALLLILLLFARFERTLETTVCDSYRQQMDTAMMTMKQSFGRAGIAASLLGADDPASLLAGATAESLKNEVLNMNGAHNSLRKVFGQSGQEYDALHLIYPRNDYLVTESFVTNDYRTEYGTRFFFEGITAEEWRARAMGSASTQPSLGKAMVMTSQDHGVTPREVVPYYVPVTDPSYIVRSGVMIFYLDADWCRDLLQTEQGIGYALLDMNGGLLLGDELNGNDSEYLTLSAANSVAPRFSLRVAIPRALISAKLSGVTRIIRLYVLLGLLGLLLLCIAYAVRHFFNIRKIVPASLGVRPESYASPYRCIRDVVQSLSDSRDTMQQRIMLLESSYANSLLVSACQRGVASLADYDECRRLMGDSAEHFCVAVMKIDENEAACAQLLEAEERFEHKVGALTVHCSPDESIFVIGVPSEEALRAVCADAEEILTDYGTVGISGVSTDPKQLHGAYQQAYHALNGCAPTQRCMLSGGEAAGEKSGWLDIDSLTRLQNTIYSGKEEQVRQYFDEIKKQAAFLVGVEQMQMFFVLRQMLLRLGNEMNIAAKEENGLNYLYDESIGNGLDRLCRFAVDITRQVQDAKGQSSGQIANAIISLIESEFSNPNLSADYLAEKMHCSPKFIYKTVREAAGATPGEIIEEYRLSFAVELLMNTDKKNDEIAALCGFGAQNTFYRIFRKKYGVAPGEWRRTQCMQSGTEK